MSTTPTGSPSHGASGGGIGGHADPGTTTSGGTSGTAHPPAPPTSATAPDVAAVSVALKLPPFWPADPELWFAQVESQFACRRITSQQSKFDYVVSSLAPEFAAEVRDLLINPPADHPYDTLKAQFTKYTTASEQKKLQLLFSSEVLGDRKPTQLLRHMQQLLGNRPGLTDESFLRELFLQRLPPNVRMVLVSTPEGTRLEQLAEIADKVMEVAGPAPPNIAGVNNTPLSKEVESLREEVARLGTLIQQLSHSRSNTRSSSHCSRRSPTPTPTNTSDSTDTSRESEPLCWYHHKYGSQAKNCKGPCSWKSNSTAGH